MVRELAPEDAISFAMRLRPQAIGGVSTYSSPNSSCVPPSADSGWPRDQVLVGRRQITLLGNIYPSMNDSGNHWDIVLAPREILE